MAGETKRTTTFDDYSTSRIKTLDDLFNYESKLLADLKTLRIKYNAESDANKKKLIKKEMKDLESGYSRIIAKVDKEAEKAIKRQTKNRLAGYAREAAEYNQFLKQQTKLSEKQRNKQVEAFKKAQKIEEDLLKKRKSREGKEELARAKQDKKRDRDNILEASKGVLGGVGTFGEQMSASISKSLENGLKQIGAAFKEIGNKINSAMDTYSKYQSSIDTRLQDSGKNFTAMQSALKKAVGASPYLKTETMLNNLQSLVEAGIVTNVEQRAFLNTIKDKVAATFDAANSSLLRIVRLQQNDSTAVRLGMEAYLTSFLNQIVENTEYLSTTFDSVQEALIEASSIMTTKASTEFEYVVQKWLGVLVGRGLSENTANQLAGALGMLGSGNVSGLSSNSLNNLLVMASANAGLDYADLLTQGLTAQNTNQLMQALVKYMQEINNSGNKVVRSQYAQTFGLSISDLMAATGMTSEEIDKVTADMLTMESMFSELGDQLNKVSSRTHISEKLANLFDNAQFSLASNIAGSAVMSAMWKVTDMIQGVTGGINIPAISVIGSGIDLETTVENLMKLGLVGIGSIGMIGDVVTGLAQSGGRFSNVLGKLGISGAANNDIISRLSSNYTTSRAGKGLKKRSRGLTSNEMTNIIANSSGEDTSEQTLNAAKDDAKKELAEAQANEDNPAADLREYFLNVFDKRFVNLLNIVATSQGYSRATLLPSLTTIHDIEFDTTAYTAGASGLAGTPVAGIQNYLVNIFDAKFSNLLAMVAHSNGYAETAADATNLLITGNAVRATYQVDEKTTGNKEILSNIENNVSNIYNLLATGVINVRMESPLSTGTSSAETSGWL